MLQLNFAGKKKIIYVLLKKFNWYPKHKVSSPESFRNVLFKELKNSTESLIGQVYIIFQKGVDNFEIEHKTC